MHWIGPTLLALSLILLLLALRGRLTVRGLFCRRCKFDLAGLDPARDNPTCPECGRDLSQPKATRATLRRSSRAGVAVGVLMLLGGGVLTGISVTNNIPRIFAAMPDRVVLGLHALGVDAAFTEIATNRLSRTNPLPESTWRALIDDAAAWQADENLAWDPRHGEVLALAMISGRLTDEEVSRYIRLATETATEFPPDIRFGAANAGLMVSRINSARSAAMNQMGVATHGQEQIMVWIKIVRAGTRDPDTRAELNSTSGGFFSIPGPFGRSSNSSQIRLPLETLDWSAVKPGDELTLFTEYEVTVQRHQSRSTIVSWTQSDAGRVLVLPADASIVTLNTDPDTIASFFDHPRVRVGPISIADPDKRSVATNFVELARAEVVLSKLPVAIAGDLYVLHDGRETRFGGITAAAIQGLSMQTVTFRLTDAAEIDEALLQSWLDAGRVTMELRPSQSMAERTHNIREILGVPLRFVGVPVTAVENTRTTFGETPEPTDTIGRPVPNTTVGEDP